MRGGNKRKLKYQITKGKIDEEKEGRKKNSQKGIRVKNSKNSDSYHLKKFQNLRFLKRYLTLLVETESMLYRFHVFLIEIIFQ